MKLTKTGSLARINTAHISFPIATSQTRSHGPPVCCKCQPSFALKFDRVDVELYADLVGVKVEDTENDVYRILGRKVLHLVLKVSYRIQQSWIAYISTYLLVLGVTHEEGGMPRTRGRFHLNIVP